MICTIISFCTNETRFLERCIREARLFSSSILIPVCDHFFDGTPENRERLERVYGSFPDCRFLEFAWNVKQLYTPFLAVPVDEQERICLWHSTGRYVAAHFLPEGTEYVLFLDADEIAEGARFAKWLENGEFRNYDALWFLSYMYRFSARERRIEQQYAPLLVKKTSLQRDLILNVKERYGHLLSIQGSHWLKGIDERPFFHHYSWVRPKDECLKKVRMWAKRAQYDWAGRLESAWKAGGFLEEDAFEIVEPFFDPLLAVGLVGGEKKNVTRIDERMLFQRGVEELINGTH